MDIAQASAATSAREYLSPQQKALEERLLQELGVLPTNEDSCFRYMNILFNNVAVSGSSVQDLVRNAARNHVAQPDGNAMQTAKRIIEILMAIPVDTYRRTKSNDGFVVEFRCAARKGVAQEDRQQSLPTMETLFG